MKEFLARKKIRHFLMRNVETKSVHAERAIRTVKQRLFRRLSMENTLKWIGLLDQVISAINHSYSRAIRMRPIDVNEENKHVVFDRLYGSYLASFHRSWPKFKFVPGQLVRLSMYKSGLLKKESDVNFTQELFRIVEQVDLFGIPGYKVQDLLGEDILGVFQEPEIRLAEPHALDHKYIEKVLRWKKDGKKKMGFVKWLGWPSKHSTWVSDSLIKQYRLPISARKLVLTSD